MNCGRQFVRYSQRSLPLVFAPLYKSLHLVPVACFYWVEYGKRDKMTLLISGDKKPWLMPCFLSLSLWLFSVGSTRFQVPSYPMKSHIQGTEVSIPSTANKKLKTFVQKTLVCWILPKIIELESKSSPLVRLQMRLKPCPTLSKQSWETVPEELTKPGLDFWLTENER
jgi:hypothetical protein